MLNLPRLLFKLLMLRVIMPSTVGFAQPVLSTGGKMMPDVWIDSVTGHKIKKLVKRDGNNISFYFHNNPFVGNNMVFYGTEKLNTSANDSVKQETGNIRAANIQLYSVNLTNGAVKQLTHETQQMRGEIVSPKQGLVYYQVRDTVFSVDIKTGKRLNVFVFPEDFRAGITTVNSDGSLLAGSWSSPKELEIFKSNPAKSSYFNLIYEAKEPRTLFTINTTTGKLEKLWTDSAWLNHVQFSPTEPNVLMFCHEGPWHKVDRIWTIDVQSKVIRKMHQRTMPMEIFGHEWFSHDGKTIWFDLQKPRSVTFFVAGADVKTGKEKMYSLERDEWSIHYNISPDQKLFCGDGGDSSQVAKAKNGMWIYLFTPSGDKFFSDKLVDMHHHNYKLEPNVHFSPDGKWIIFRANFEGHTDIYAVEIAKAG